MIGYIDYASGGQASRAVLKDDGSWDVPDPLVAALLNLKHHISNYGPWAGAFGMAALHDAAETLHGKVTVVRQPAKDDGKERVY